MFSTIMPSQMPLEPTQAANFKAEDPVRALQEAELRQSAQEFEASYIAQMLTFSGLDKALMAGGGEEVAAFTSFYVESFAEQIAEKGGFGLADDFYSRMLKMSGLSEIDNSDLTDGQKNGETDNVDFGKL